MGTRGIQDPVAADLIEELLAEQARLRTQIDDLRQAKPVMMERARPDDLTVPQEGQVVVDPDGSHPLATGEGIKYFANQQWRGFPQPDVQMPWAQFLSAAGPGATEPTLETSNFSGGAWQIKQISFPAASDGGIDYDTYDYSGADQIFDVSGSELPGFFPLGIKKKGLYLVSCTTVWPVLTYGKLTKLSLEVTADNPVHDGKCPHLPAFNKDEYVTEDACESGDANAVVSTSTVLRNTVNQLFWIFVKARHKFGSTINMENTWVTAIRWSPNPNDTDPFEGGEI